MTTEKTEIIQKQIRKTDKVLNVINTNVGTLVELAEGNIIIIRTLEDLETLANLLRK